MLSESQKQRLINAAIFAPSADNSQPFQFHWQNDNTLALWIDPKRSGKASDNRFVLSDIALGAVIENIIICAESFPLSTQVEYFPEGEQNELFVACIYFLPSEQALNDADNLVDEIPKRCTDRRFPFKGPIKTQSIELLTNAAKQRDCDLLSFTGKKSIKAVLPVIQKAETIRFKSQILHQELFSTVHFGNPNAEEGMPISVLAIEKPAQPLFKQMKKWSVMNFMNRIGGAAILGFRSVRIPILLSPALVLITMTGKDRLNVIKAGRAIQRVWLQASQQGLSVQPYAAPGIFSLGYIACENEFKAQLDAIAQQMHSIVNSSNDSKGNYGLMFLRIGYNKPVVQRSNRRSFDSFVKK
ncbi:MAG: hypothetical protein OQK09_09895 [Colwellia sp.]|nr:hypothetical protein [Colwellia sp.]MCW8865793.1 hypothetical protein [Colwellia sp.]MCW9081809.1 hypothetical protein [Colwellia sp.]